MNEYSEYYLERVGHEANGNLRQKLKKGKNIVGRIDSEDVSVGVDSLFCSRRHCVITVSGNSVDIKDLNTSKGTTVNGVIIKGETRKLDELDVIGIVGGSNVLSHLVGNHYCFVYRLCKYNSNNIATIQIDDIETFQISDDDDDIVNDDESDIICLDDSRLELNVNLTDQFNTEVNRELQELEELEAYCKQFKKEPSDFFSLESTSEIKIELNNNANTHQAFHDVGNIYSEPIYSVSADSTRFLIHVKGETTESPTDLGNSPLCNNIEEGSDIWFQNIDTKSEIELEQAIMRVSDRTVEKQRPKIIEPKSLRKRRKTVIYDYPQNDISKPQTSFVYKDYIKDKLKRISAAKPKPAAGKPKVKITPKVKNTINNRGAFLTDPNQAPVLPKDVAVCRKYVPF